MRSPRAFLTAFAVFSALVFGAQASADDACDCQGAYDNRMAVCNGQSLSDESRSLCYATAKSNLDACTNSCNSGN